MYLLPSCLTGYYQSSSKWRLPKDGLKACYKGAHGTIAPITGIFTKLSALKAELNIHQKPLSRAEIERTHTLIHTWVLEEESPKETKLFRGPKENWIVTVKDTTSKKGMICIFSKNYFNPDAIQEILETLVPKIQ